MATADVRIYTQLYQRMQWISHHDHHGIIDIVRLTQLLTLNCKLDS